MAAWFRNLLTKDTKGAFKAANNSVSNDRGTASALSLHKLCKYGGYGSQLISVLSLKITGFRSLTIATNDNAKITLRFRTGNAFRVWLYPGRLIILQMRLAVVS